MNHATIGVIGIPGKWSTETLADAIAQRTGKRTVIDMQDVCADLGSGELRAGDVNLCQLDALVVKKISQQYSPQVLDRLELLRVAEAAGVRIFSRPDHLLRMIDRLACTVTLRNHDIPMPPTRITEDREEAIQAIREFGTAVLKPMYSSKAEGMMVVDATSESELTRSVDAFRSKNSVMYIQQKIDLQGRDVGLLFLGGEYLGAYARVAAEGSWNTTTNSGGKYMPYEPSSDTINIAARAQALFNLDITTVDIADADDGPMVFEVSAFGGFRGASKATGMDVASMYADYIVSELQHA